MNAYQARRLPLLLVMVTMCLSTPPVSVAQVEAAKTFFHEPLPRSNPSVSDFAISPNMKMLATCGPNDDIQLWSFETGELIHKFYGDISTFTKVAFSDENMILAAGDGWGRVWLWDIPTQKLIHRFDNPDLADDPDPTSGHYAVLGLDFGAGNRLLALQIRRSLAVWDIETGERIQALNEIMSSATGYDLVFLPGEIQVAVIMPDNIKVVDLREESSTRIFTGYGGAISENGTEAFTIRENDFQRVSINRWNIETGELVEQSPIIELGGRFARYPGVNLSKNGVFAVISGDGPFPALRRPGVESALRTFDGNALGGLRRFKFSPDMNYLAATGGVGDGHVYVYDISDLTTGVPNATLHENE